MMERIAKKLTAYIVGKGIVAESEEKIYLYGLQMGLELIFNLRVSIWIAIKMDMLPEAAVFFSVFIPIRSYAGGFHFDRYLECFALSVVSYVGVLEGSKYLMVAKGLLIFAAVVFLFLVRCLFPVQNVRRILDENEKKYFSQKLNRILCGELLIIIVLGLLDRERLLRVANLTLALIVVTMVAGKMKFYILQQRRKKE